MNETMNGKARKTLASQIDRLDGILDGLSEAIPEVIADTIRAVAAQAVRDAVRAAVSEVLTNPTVLEGLRSAATPITPIPQTVASQPMPKNPPVLQRAGSAIQACWSWVRGKASQAFAAILRVTRTCAGTTATGAVNAWNGTRSLASSTWSFLALLWSVASHFRTPLLIASGVGAAIGVGCYFAGPLVEIGRAS